MKEIRRDENGASAAQVGNLVAILAIMTAMARRVNRSISKVELEPIRGALLLGDAVTKNKRSET